MCWLGRKGVARLNRSLAFKFADAIARRVDEQMSELERSDLQLMILP